MSAPKAAVPATASAAGSAPAPGEAAFPAESASDEAARPTRLLPLGHLLRISAYWLGLTCVMQGVAAILAARVQFVGLAQPGHEGAVVLQISILGTLIAIVVQPTVGSISDYTISRWGRRKPYIVIGSLLDLVFLYGLATSNAVPALAAFMTLLQVSSNFAQGPFQGYVPDLVPERQVGLASGLMGLFMTLGNVLGFLVAALAIGWHATEPRAYFFGMMALGAIEVGTMLSVVIRVDEGREAKPREGRSWFAVAREVWATDILNERSFLWLVASRLFILMAGSLIVTFGTFYLAQSFGYDETQTKTAIIELLAAVVVGTVVAVVPASRISDRLGRKPVIYASCALGATGLAIVAVAPSLPVALPGVVLFGVSAGSFLAVDWALLTDIVPKASAGRYMGISNVATASCGLIAQIVGGAIVMDIVNQLVGYGAGPRAAMLMGVIAYGIGAVMLVPVQERRNRAAGREASLPA